MSLYSIFKYFAFKCDPEFIHENSIKFLSKFPRIASLPYESESSMKYSCKVGSQVWTFPIGLAAGLDKNAEAIQFFSSINFGAVEVGTVTPKSQVGNEKPRLFRLPEEESLRNRMGFNNGGMDQVQENILNSFPVSKALGINLGKNKKTPNETFYEDYVLLYKQFASIANYLVINVSSPNTPGLRELQGRAFLEKLFFHLRPLREKQPVDLYIKIAPDMDEDSLKDIISLASEEKLTGIIATNTSYMPEIGEGGVSGKLIKKYSRDFRSKVLDHLKNTKLEFIGVGGVDSYEDLVQFWKSGGKVMQVYTGFIYKGPDLLKEIKDGIDADLKKYNLKNLEELADYYRERNHE